MNSTIILQGLEILGHCGLTQEERRKLQPIRVDLELDCSNSHAGTTDNIKHTIDYAKVISLVMEFGVLHHFSLVESLAEHLSQILFEEFPILSLKLWVKKTNPPLTATIDSVGVRLIRNRESIRPVALTSHQPASFLLQQHQNIPKGTVLDVATGYGRNALYLASQGYSIVGIDRDTKALQALQQEAQSLNLPDVSVQTCNLEDESPSVFSLGTEAYEGIIVFFYLYRPLFPALIRALKQGGVLVYETFLIDNHRINHHPRRQEFCLQRNELLQLAKGLRIVHYEEGAYEGATFNHQTFTARMVAKKESLDMQAC